jgi:L-rhamnose mutarotase
MVSKLENLLSSPGYFVGFTLSHSELDSIRQEIKKQWVTRIGKLRKDLVDEAERVGIENYHLFSEQLPHQVMWPKLERILPKKSLNTLKSMPFMQKLNAIFGDFLISDEEDVGREEIYWRLVRPNEPSDVGPIHADRWFWELGHGTTPDDKKRVKVWIPIYSEPFKNGIKVVADSHLKNWRYHGEEKSGFLKPVIDECETTLGAQLLPLEPGQALVFNDGLLHGGAINLGQKTRVSVEFTIFTNNF